MTDHKKYLVWHCADDTDGPVKRSFGISLANRSRGRSQRWQHVCVTLTVEEAYELIGQLKAALLWKMGDQ